MNPGWNGGSRVLVLIDDIPLLSGDMGQIPWDLIPIENIDQIEVTKGSKLCNLRFFCDERRY